MRQFEFTPEVVAQIARDRFEHPHPHPRVQLKLEVLWLWFHGLAPNDVARLGGVSRRTAERYRNEFRQGGLEATRTVPWHGPTSELAGHSTSLENEFRAGLANSTGECACTQPRSK